METPSKSIKEIVERSYEEYSREVAKYRALPDYRDGLKRVQRRILLTIKKLGISEVHKCASIIGECIKRYHPHGDSAIYDTIVTLVNSKNNLVKGEGNFGFSGLHSYPPAAFRYTSAGITNLGEEFLRFVAFSKHFINENDNKEVEYLPVPIPYALLGSSIGIGVGVVTLIPRFDPVGLINLAKAIVRKEKELPLVYPDGGEVTQEDLISINKNGTGKVTYKAEIFNYNDTSSQNLGLFYVEGTHEFVNLSKILAEFKDEIQDEYIFVRDETSGDTPKVVIGKSKRARKISEEEVLERLKKCTTRTVKVKITVSMEGQARTIGIHDYVRHSVEHCMMAYGKSLEEEIEKIEKEIKFDSIKNRLSALVLGNETKEEIQKQLNLSEEELDSFLNRSLSSLRPRTGMKEKLEETKTKLVNLESSFEKEVIASHPANRKK